ncbi:MchC protein [Brenneria goodwinii]|uniref:MchC protein n=1 Tax=Brenneria goodwinii TaxID=1109412 RepID=UPI000EF1D59E|nr:MchC protein [Brenneria goodwinii]MCG8157794.1 MchC protein [Brenneria goodwinii]MCG8161741.1 MchC protein [Brenneria goodwinii]MCG8166625.1 MchC protein [Brenneria goodwinii]MCG8171417.1 MchC protein [Brenneria goodwinii]MCG8175376.1 MchC protein [Brenneria goodwinii]
MSHNPMLADLTENLVPFEAHQVTSSLIWCGPDVNDGEALHNACSYLIGSIGSGTSKIFQAERYGGSGIQRNGGGARCGFDGRYQVKGIGANPLVGQGSDWHHSNGALGASQAIYEALWGEVLAQVLPYGAVRAQAVLLTDNYTDIKFERSRGVSRRALLVREPTVRPAHFERAPYFRPQSQYSGQLMHDARRVRSAIRKLPASLPTPSEGFSEEAYHDPQHHCIEGLCELARRQAQQMAFCRTRFLMLTTSPSNIAMDGRLLDFNGLNCLFPSDHRYDFEYKLKLTQLMKEPAILQQGLSDLCLYLGKYLFDPEFTLYSRQQVGACFQQTFQEACYRGYLTLLGISADMLSPKETPEPLERLVDSFIKLFGSRSGTLYCPPNDDRTESPLEQLVVTLIRRSQGLAVPGCGDLENDVRFAETLRFFTEASHWLVKTCRARGSDTSSILKKMEQQARRRLQPRSFLSKVRMLEEIAGLLEAHSGDDLHLRQALSVMEEKMQIFAREAFGRQQSVNHIPERCEKT